MWQPPSPLGSLASLTGASVDTFAEANRAAAEHARRVAREGVRIASEAGLTAEPATVRTTRPAWTAILEIADRHDAATIVMGSRARTGVHSTPVGSVSSAVVHHAARPALVVPQPVAHE